MASPPLNFERSVDAVLDDADALNAFREWIRLDPTRSADVLKLHYGLKAYQKDFDRNSQHAASLAQELHRRLISLNTGSCKFLPSEVRQEMSSRIHRLSKSAPSRDIFEPVRKPLSDILRSWHAQFVGTEPFFRFMKDRESESPEPTYADAQDEPITNQSSFDSKYDCDASTSRFDVSIPKVTAQSCAQEEFMLMKQHGAVRHDVPEAREVFVDVVSQKLQRIQDALVYNGDVMYARQLTPDRYSPFMERDATVTASTSKQKDRSLSFASGPSGFHPHAAASQQHDLFNDSSDEEVEKYLGRIDNERSDSMSPRNTFAMPPNMVNPYGKNGFAPPPIGGGSGYDFSRVSLPTAGTMSRQKRSTGIHDSSGFCSAESAFYDMNHAAAASDHGYGGSRSIYSGGFNMTSISNPPFGAAPYSSHTMQRRPHFVPQVPNHHIFATLPRRPIDCPPVSCKLWWKGEVAPYALTIEGFNIRLADFKRAFKLSKKENIMLMFKSESDDGDAPYQWTLVSDDSEVLPLFQGKISAEATYSVDSDSES